MGREDGDEDVCAYSGGKGNEEATELGTQQDAEKRTLKYQRNESRAPVQMDNGMRLQVHPHQPQLSLQMKQLFRIVCFAWGGHVVRDARASELVVVVFML